MENLYSFFFDPLLRAPTLGCMLMCLGASLVGVIVFLQKQSLIGEVLSHAAYPGVILGTIVAGLLSVKEFEETKIALLILTGAFSTSLIGLGFIRWMEKMKIPSDAALCFVLSTFFGIGITLTSEVQFSFTALYKQVLTYLYGQAATMTDSHIIIYSLLAIGISLVIFLFYKEIQLLVFDRDYAKSLNLPIQQLDLLLFSIITVAVIIGIRSVGVVLMSAMLIAPAAAARQFTQKLPTMFMLAGLFGLLSGFFGVYTSVQGTILLAQFYPLSRINLPTGPMIVLVASLICLLALLFAPERGWVIRLFRIANFRFQCIGENILKTIWRFQKNGQDSVSLKQLQGLQSVSSFYLSFIIWRLQKEGWIKRENAHFYELTQDGNYRAEKIVRLHRLWEVYLTDYLGIGGEKVHRNAEEMEHILTPELERELALLLNDPKEDPHHQPIPPEGGFNG